MAAVTVYANDNVEEIEVFGGRVTGHLAKDGDAYVAVEWKFPDPSLAGSYECQAFGMDSHGHPRMSYDNATGNL